MAIETEFIQLLNTLFLGMVTIKDDTMHWGYEFGPIFLSITHKLGDKFVTGFFNCDDTVGYKIYGQNDLLDYIWHCGYIGKNED